MNEVITHCHLFSQFMVIVYIVSRLFLSMRTLFIVPIFHFFMESLWCASSGINIQLFLVKYELYVKLFCTAMIFWTITNKLKHERYFFFLFSLARLSRGCLLCLELKFPMNRYCIHLRNLLWMLYVFFFSIVCCHAFLVFLSHCFFCILHSLLKSILHKQEKMILQ